MKCGSGKRTYWTERDAYEALLGAHVNFHFSGGGPVNYYLCDQCGNYHLTSSGERHKDLDSDETTKRISLEKEAREWERKLR